MSNIRRAEHKDVSRIAEILVFSKRLNFRRIFQNDDYSFGELQVLSIANEYLNNKELLQKTWVYEASFVKGLIQIEGHEVKTLYVDSFFTNEGIGGALLQFAIEQFDVRFLWALEKNQRAIHFYKKYGFEYANIWKYEEGTTECLLRLERLHPST